MCMYESIKMNPINPYNQYAVIKKDKRIKGYSGPYLNIYVLCISTQEQNIFLHSLIFFLLIPQFEVFLVCVISFSGHFIILFVCEWIHQLLQAYENAFADIPEKSHDPLVPEHFLGTVDPLRPPLFLWKWGTCLAHFLGVLLGTGSLHPPLRAISAMQSYHGTPLHGILRDFLYLQVYVRNVCNAHLPSTCWLLLFALFLSPAVFLGSGNLLQSTGLHPASCSPMTVPCCVTFCTLAYIHSSFTLKCSSQLRSPNLFLFIWNQCPPRNLPSYSKNSPNFSSSLQPQRKPILLLYLNPRFHGYAYHFIQECASASSIVPKWQKTYLLK